MPFSSIHFLFLFLPVFLLFYYLPIRNLRGTLLLIFSILFFAWTDPGHIPLLVAIVLFNYSWGRLIEQLNSRSPHSARIQMWLAVSINILVLCFYKYLGFFGDAFQALTHIQFNFAQRSLPLGISYFTFSSIAYIVDIFNGVNKAEKNIIRFSCYLVMFPKLMQGPITRFGEVKDELEKPRLSLEAVFMGTRRFIIGLAKKVILADTLAVAANKVFETDPTTFGASVAWFGLIAFTLQIYFDFSGYTDMAIGLGKMLGFNLPENFNFPYISRSISDFWRRWHMSLTAWFRTFLFIPIEFARRNEKILRQQTNLLLVFLLTGLWHGASWNYVIWGGYFGLILAFEASGLGKWLKKMPAILQHSYSLALVMLGWVFFRLTNLAEWGNFLGALSGANGWKTNLTLRNMNILFYLPLMVLATVLATPLLDKAGEKMNRRPLMKRFLVDTVLLGLFALSVFYLLAYGFSPFMYSQF